MIIECVNCSKKFIVNADLIPRNGRSIKCGSCEHVWFYKPTDKIFSDEPRTIDKKEPDNISNNIEDKRTKSKSNKNKSKEIIKYKPKSNFSFAKFLSYILVIIISFIGLILILDTFKTPLYNFFPNLEFFLFSLYETLKDIQLFIKDMI